MSAVFPGGSIFGGPPAPASGASLNERFTVPRSNGALEHPLNTHLDLDNAEEDKRNGDAMAVIGFGVMLVLFLWWLLSNARLGLRRKH